MILWVVRVKYVIALMNCHCGGKSLNFCIGSQVPFTNGNASEDEQMTEKAPERMVV